MLLDMEGVKSYLNMTGGFQEDDEKLAKLFAAGRTLFKGQVSLVTLGWAGEVQQHRVPGMFNWHPCTSIHQHRDSCDGRGEGWG